MSKSARNVVVVALLAAAAIGGLLALRAWRDKPEPAPPALKPSVAPTPSPASPRLRGVSGAELDAHIAAAYRDPFPIAPPGAARTLTFDDGRVSIEAEVANEQFLRRLAESSPSGNQRWNTTGNGSGLLQLTGRIQLGGGQGTHLVVDKVSFGGVKLTPDEIRQVVRGDLDFVIPD